MSKYKNNNPPQKKVAMVGYAKAAEHADEEKIKKPINKTTVIALSVVAALVLTLIFGVFAFLLRDESFDYMKSDLRDYITLTSDDYKNYTVEVKFDEVTDADIERKIMRLLYQNKSKEAQNKGADVVDVPVSVGDTVKIYYRGYTVDADGREHEIEGASNMLDSYYSLGVGSLSSINGFEEGLIGALPAEHRFDRNKNYVESGSVQTGDVIYLSYSVMLPDGKTEIKQSERIDLSDSKVDNYYGEGFIEYFESSNIIIGNKISEQIAFAVEGGTAVYFDMKVNCATRCDSQPLTIEARFPANYREKSLRGKDVKFDVYFKSSVVYDVPEYNEEFITETLKLTADKLEKYEGESILQKHRAYLLEQATAENEQIRESLIEEAVWDYYNGIVEVKALPKKQKNAVYEELYAEIYTEYSTYYSSMYPSFDSFVLARYGATQNVSPLSLIENEAENIVIEKLIFYYIIREEQLIPEDDEFKKSYEQFVSEHLDYYVEDIYASELAKLENEEKKQARIAEIKKEMMDYFGEEYFADLVYYDYAYDKIISFANIVEK